MLDATTPNAAERDRLTRLSMDGEDAKGEFVMAAIESGVVSGATKKWRNNPRHDLIVAECIEGLLDVVDTFDPDRARFKTHAHNKMQQCVERAVAENAGAISVPVRDFRNGGSLAVTASDAALDVYEACAPVDHLGDWGRVSEWREALGISDRDWFIFTACRGRSIRPERAEVRSDLIEAGFQPLSVQAIGQAERRVAERLREFATLSA